jgi:hypothetical protein
MTSSEAELIARVLQEAGRSLPLVEITDALNSKKLRPRPYTYDEVRGHLEQMDDVHESRGTYCLKG